MKKIVFFILLFLCNVVLFILIRQNLEMIEVVKLKDEENPLILVNKENGLSRHYVPNNLFLVEGFDQVREIFLKENCYIALGRFNEFLQSKEIYITLFSGYRSYQYQEQIFTDENYQAKPGYSEHQTGLAIDLSLRDVGLMVEFQDTKEYQFILKNCYKFGFILRYPKDKEKTTSYPFEPWHLRYVGVKASTYMADKKLCLEEYLKLKK